MLIELYVSITDIAYVFNNYFKDGKNVWNN